MNSKSESQSSERDPVRIIRRAGPLGWKELKARGCTWRAISNAYENEEIRKAGIERKGSIESLYYLPEQHNTVLERAQKERIYLLVYDMEKAKRLRLEKALQDHKGLNLGWGYLENQVHFSLRRPEDRDLALALAKKYDVILLEGDELEPGLIPE